MTVQIPRRDALIGLGAICGLGLVGCSESSTTESDNTDDDGRRQPPPTGLASVSDIEVGSSISTATLDGAPIILSRPAKNKVVGFSAVCTHQGCTVQPAGKRLDCPCHGSAFDAMTGAVLQGPAQRDLAPFDVKVVRGTVRPA